MQNDIIITNTEVEAALKEDGFKVVPLLHKNQVEELYALYETYFPEKFHPPKLNFNSNVDCPRESKLKVQEKIKSIFLPLLDKVFSGYKIVNAILFIKKPSHGQDG